METSLCVCSLQTPSREKEILLKLINAPMVVDIV